MRIVDLTEFRAMPEGTIFCKYSPCNFGDLEIKGETWESDFICASLTGCIESDGSDDMLDKLLKYEKTKESFSLNVDYYGRDGLYDKEQLYAIYENADIEQLITRLKLSIK